MLMDPGAALYARLEAGESVAIAYGWLRG